MSTVIEDNAIEDVDAMPDQQGQDQSTLLLRVNILEQQLKQLQDQLKSYVPVRENELQLQSIQSTVTRMERDVVEMRTKLETQEKETRTRDEQQRESQAKLQIRVLYGILTAIGAVALTVLAGFLTHVLH